LAFFYRIGRERKERKITEERGNGEIEERGKRGREIGIKKEERRRRKERRKKEKEKKE
jgi:hypothetical protein